eukprot:c18645_g1_i2 orf=81-335(+)
MVSSPYLFLCASPDVAASVLCLTFWFYPDVENSTPSLIHSFLVYIHENYHNSIREGLPPFSDCVSNLTVIDHICIQSLSSFLIH